MPPGAREELIFEAEKTKVFEKLNEIRSVYGPSLGFFSSSIYSDNPVRMALNIDKTLAQQLRVSMGLGIPVVSALDFLKTEMKLRLLKRTERQADGHWNHTLWQDVLNSGKISHFILPPDWTNDHPEISIDEYGIARHMRRQPGLMIIRLEPRFQ